MSRPTVIPVLRALRAQGLGDARQSDHVWTGECPLCFPYSGAHNLTISEHADHAPATLRCANRCHPSEIATALGLGATGKFRTRPVALERVTPFRWAWQDRVLLGYLNLLVGDEGIGKGTFIAWLVARLTRGQLAGDLHGEPARVLIVGDEDGFDNVTVPRLVAAGADVDYVLDLPIGDEGALDVGRDAAGFRELLRDEGIRVVIFDQLLDNIGAGVDTWRQTAVRAALAPARRIAAELDVAMLCTLHPNKSGAAIFRKRVPESLAFNALSRSSLFLAEHPDDPARRVLVRGKGNYSAPPPAIEFKITAEPVELNGHTHHPSMVTGLVESTVALAEILEADTGGVASKAKRAREIIADALASGDWCDAAPIRAQLEAAGISTSGMRRAGNDLGIERRRTSGFPSRNEWRLVRAHARGGAPTEPTDPTAPTGRGEVSGSSGRSETSPPRARTRPRASRRRTPAHAHDAPAATTG